MLKRQGKLKLRSRESWCIAAGNTIAYLPKGAVIEGTEYGLDKSSAFRMLVCLQNVSLPEDWPQFGNRAL